MFFVADANAFVSGATGKAISHLAPQRPGKESRLQGESIGWVSVLPVQSRDANGTRRQNFGIDEIPGFRNFLHPSHGVDQRDKRVGLTAAVLRPQSDDRGYLPALAGQTEAYCLQQLLHPPRWVALGEERSGIEVICWCCSVNDA
jgi:hypothetical protein